MRKAKFILIAVVLAVSFGLVSCGKGTGDNPPEEHTKTISFLGDSISTYQNWSNNTEYNATIGPNAVWFPNNNYAGADMSVEKTWWRLACEQLGYELCVNNSWSGSKVTEANTYNKRAVNLHRNDGTAPDVIVIFMGVNDFAEGVPVGTYDGTAAVPENPSKFSDAYGCTLAAVCNRYCDAEVYCCTFLPDRKRFSGDVSDEEKKYNRAIRSIAENMGANLIDLYRDSGITPDNIGDYTVDRLHPNENGMALIAQTVAAAIRTS